jgi:hypothetical protein
MKEFTYRKQIRVSTPDLIAAKAGKKRCTIRLGKVSVAEPEIYLTDGKDRARVRITEIDHSKTFGALSQREVEGEGFNTKTDLESDLRKYYRGVAEGDSVSIIWFEVLTSP